MIIEIKPAPELLDALHELADACRVMAAAMEARAPGDAAPKQRKPRVDPARSIRTPEREALLRELWPTEPSDEVIRTRLNALPGNPIASREGVRKWANELGLQRPKFRADWTPERRAEIRRRWEAGELAPDIHPIINAMPGQPVTMEQVEAWARGQCRRPAWFVAQLRRYKQECMTARAAGRPAPLPFCPAPPASATRVPASGAPNPSARPAPCAPVERQPLPAVLRMDSEQLRNWAAVRGIRLDGPISDADLRRCREKARDLGLPPIEFVHPGGRVAA